MEQRVLTVSQLNNYLKALVDSDAALRRLTVKGEISNFTNHQRSGHFYFSIKDASCSMRVVMFKTYASRVRFEPQNGMNVLVTGSVRLFERDGAVQLYCEDLQPDGIGALYLAYEQMKERLEQEGLFDVSHKRPLPSFPKRIGVVTSKTGAALQDIYNILSRRYPIGELLLIPALVQGAEAPESICQAIELAQKVSGVDLLIVGRGGGSLEDLWAFNDERVARAIYRSSVPVISAVGHEIDFTIADFVADLRAPTPSAAAELAVPDCTELGYQMQNTARYLKRLLDGKLQWAEDQLSRLKGRLERVSPAISVNHYRDQLAVLEKRLHLSAAQTVERKQQQFLKQTALLEALNPVRVLTRGYTITYHNGKILQADAEVLPGDLLLTELAEKQIRSRVETVEQKGQ